MGIQGLLQLLKPALRETKLSKYRSKTAAIDIMTWLYKGAYSCAYELGLEQQTFGFISYPIKMLKLVQSYGIKPICVFDEQSRKDNKKTNKDLALQYAREGKIEEAKKYFMRCLQLRSKMIDLLMDILKVLDIEYIKAPYEADAQIAYLVREGIADIAISEDSDLIAFGCPRLVTKLDFRGCDYLPSISRVGLKVAVKFFIKHSTIEEVIEGMKANATYANNVPFNYLEALKKVQTLFFYQTVYNPRSKQFTQLEQLPEGFISEDIDFLGAHLPDEKIQNYVSGNLKKDLNELRDTYRHILDLKFLLEDYKMNCLSDRSFICLDPSFFNNNTEPSKRYEKNQQKPVAQEMPNQNKILNITEEFKKQEQLLKKPLDITEILVNENLGQNTRKNNSNNDIDIALIESLNESGLDIQTFVNNTEPAINLKPNVKVKNDISFLEDLCQNIKKKTIDIIEKEKCLNDHQSEKVSLPIQQNILRLENVCPQRAQKNQENSEQPSVGLRSYEQVDDSKLINLKAPNKNPFLKSNTQPSPQKLAQQEKELDSFKKFDQVREYLEYEEKKQKFLSQQMLNEKGEGAVPMELMFMMQFQQHEIINEQDTLQTTKTRKTKKRKAEEISNEIKTIAKIDTFFNKKVKVNEQQ
ncbi:xpg family protein [Stylonychia lemnae]|uniref:Exonuclease 1 n=1 Tax=Stylonychia lemnae TaxID=5949 RepID=A0A077ZZ19_STYLE|nr:xpg family protein [Stylonychia lemnae]|eukprot:CDW73778.1 xpg family protein [Stylonychia lemnae]